MKHGEKDLNPQETKTETGRFTVSAKQRRSGRDWRASWPLLCMKPDRADGKFSGSLGKSTSRECNAVERRRRGFYKGAARGEPSLGVFGGGRRTHPKPTSLGEWGRFEMDCGLDFTIVQRHIPR